MNILVTGATGLIGSELMGHLAQTGHRAISLRRKSADAGPGPEWNPLTGELRLEAATPAPDAVVHLAGETIAQPWSTQAKERIRSSRVDSTRRLCANLARLAQPPRIFICASATGYYGDRGDEFLDEQSRPGHGFLAEVCKEWEAASESCRAAGIRVVQLRFGIILAQQGGALAKMLPVFRLGVGGRIGTGQQYWSWLALEDLSRIIEHVLSDDDLNGPINAVAPAPVTNSEFTASLASALGRPALLPVPGFAVKLFFGEMGRETLLASTRVRPKRLLESGFEYRFPELRAAFQSILTKKS